jgi:SAM-dependent methyltransferase
VKFASFVEAAERYYSGRFEQHGATAAGVDWRDEASQMLRFEQLLRVVVPASGTSLNDYGCGYGALAAYLDEGDLTVDYVGFDVSPSMVQHARATFPQRRFVTSEEELPVADYTVASGIFNVKLDAEPAAWREYVIETITRLRAHSRRGLAFNMLTSYSDPDRMRDDLYYGDPSFFFDWCERNLSRHVALLHDYGLWEWTVLVRIEDPV